MNRLAGSVFGVAGAPARPGFQGARPLAPLGLGTATNVEAITLLARGGASPLSRLHYGSKNQDGCQIKSGMTCTNHLVSRRWGTPVAKHRVVHKKQPRFITVIPDLIRNPSLSCSRNTGCQIKFGMTCTNHLVPGRWGTPVAKHRVVHKEQPRFITVIPDLIRNPSFSSRDIDELLHKYWILTI